MIYVKERRADSICVTEDWFLVIKVLYMLSHLGGKLRRFWSPCRGGADLGESITVLLPEQMRIVRD